MKKKSPLIVGVSQRVDIHDETGERRDSIDQKLFLWLMAAGFMPVQIPNAISQNSENEPDAINSENKLRDWLELIKPERILLSGGNDIGQCPERDETESLILEWSRANSIPLLGICRGLQIITTWSGTNLIKTEGHVRTRHTLKFVSNDENFPLEVNSYHNWVPEYCPKGFEITAYAEDGSIEAFKHNTLPWEAWMWHPERETPFNNSDINRLKNLFYG